jgi:hypothetical protein
MMMTIPHNNGSSNQRLCAKPRPNLSNKRKLKKAKESQLRAPMRVAETVT